MAATRPSWSGNLRFSLVIIPVQLFGASKSTRNIPLHQLHKPTLKRVHNQPIVEGVGPIDKKDIVKGYEYKKGSHVVLSKEELDNIRLETNKSITIVEFSDAKEIDEIYYDKPYYVVPEGDAAYEAYAVFQQALKQTGKVAVGEVVLSGKEHLVAIKPYGKGLLLELLRYADEVRSAHAYFSDFKAVKIDDDQLELAVSLIDKKTAKFDPGAFDDSYESALQELIDRKLKNMPLKAESEPRATRVVDLMDALKKSLGGEEDEDEDDDDEAATPKPKAKKAAAKSAPAKKATKTAKKSAPAKAKPAAKKASGSGRRAS